MPAPGDADGVVALDASLTFAAGTITGHIATPESDGGFA